jgi:hypothetical protein
MTTRQNNVKITKEVRDIIHGYVMSVGPLAEVAYYALA